MTRAGATAIGLDISLRTASAPADDRAVADAIAELGAHVDRRLVVANTALPSAGGAALRSRHPALRDYERARRAHASPADFGQRLAS